MAEEELLPHYSSLTGSWVLDISRSDTMAAYLRLLGTPESTIEALTAAEQAAQSRNAITLDDSQLAIYKHTAINHYTETFTLNEEHVIASDASGTTQRYKVSLLNEGDMTGYRVEKRTTSSGGRDMSLVDSRRLEGHGHNHTQELNVRNNTTDTECTIVRTWVRVPMSNNDLHRLGRCGVVYGDGRNWTTTTTMLFDGDGVR
ncbi:unnamed protein product [Pylaiella littoralis]